jgi:hypothetical protein
VPWRHRQLTAQPVADRKIVVRLGSSGSPAPRAKAVEATGLTTVPSDEFGRAPRAPMMPGSWDQNGGSDGFR